MKWYLINSTSPYAPTTGSKSSTNPANALGANNASSGQQSPALSDIKGASAGGTNHTFASDASTAARSNYMGRWTSAPLTAQSISSGTWTIALGLNESNTNAKSFLAIAVYIAAQGGSSKKATIYDSGSNIGTEWATSTTGAGRVITFSGAAVSVDAGDCLVVEIFRNAIQTMATSYSQILYFGGSTEPTNGGNVTANDVASYLDSPAAITLAQPVFDQTAAAFYEDGTESGSSLISGGASATRDISGGDVAVQVRAVISETGGIVGGDATDDFELRFRLNNAGAWQSLVAIGTADSYDFANADGVYTLGSGNAAGGAQSFTGDGNKLYSVTLMLGKLGSPTGTATIRVYAHSGTYGTSSVPTGAALASYSLDVSTLTTTQTAYEFFFDSSNQPTLTGGTRYVLAIEYPGHLGNLLDNSNNIRFSRDASSPTHGGNYSAKAPTNWGANSNVDIVFEVKTSAVIAVEAFDSANLTEGQATTSRLGGSAGKVTEDGTVDDLAIGAGASKELLASVILKQSQLANGNTLDFRFYRNGQALDAYTVTPRITIGAGATGFTLTATARAINATRQAAALTLPRLLSANVRAATVSRQSVNLNFTRSVTAQSRELTLTRQSVALTQERRIAATARALTLEGKEAVLSIPVLQDYTLEVLPRALTLAGAAVNLALARNITADARALEAGRQAADLRFERRLAALVKSLTLEGQSINLAQTRSLEAQSKALSLTRETATLGTSLKIDATTRAITLTPQSVNLFIPRLLSADVRSLALTGQTATLDFARFLSAQSRSLELSGAAVTLTLSRTISADTHALSLTGQQVFLTYLADYTLQAETGTFVLTREAANLNAARAMQAVAVALELDAQAVTLGASRALTASARALDISRNAANLLFSRSVSAQTRPIVLEGKAVVLAAAGAFILSALTGALEITGNQANLYQTRTLAAQNGALNLNRNAVNLLLPRSLTATAGEIEIAGQAANLNRSYGLAAQPGVITITGNEATFIYLRNLLAQVRQISLSGKTANLMFHSAGLDLLPPLTVLLWSGHIAATIDDETTPCRIWSGHIKARLN